MKGKVWAPSFMAHHSALDKTWHIRVWSTMPLDSRYMTILPAPNTGSLCYSYKHHFSIVLLALVDAQYDHFKYVDVRSHGRRSDAHVSNNSQLLAHVLDNHQLQANIFHQPHCHSHHWYIIHMLPVCYSCTYSLKASLHKYCTLFKLCLQTND